LKVLEFDPKSAQKASKYQTIPEKNTYSMVRRTQYVKTYQIIDPAQELGRADLTPHLYIPRPGLGHRSTRIRFKRLVKREAFVS
jgi:hypothetical protein